MSQIYWCIFQGKQISPKAVIVCSTLTYPLWLVAMQIFVQKYFFWFYSPVMMIEMWNKHERISRSMKKTIYRQTIITSFLYLLLSPYWTLSNSLHWFSSWEAVYNCILMVESSLKGSNHQIFIKALEKKRNIAQLT